MQLAHQHIVRRINTPPRRTRLRWVLLALLAGGWCGYCFATPGRAEPIGASHGRYIMGAPGSTATDWAEGTASEDSPELNIDIRRCKYCRVSK